jgi:hypothetical protein
MARHAPTEYLYNDGDWQMGAIKPNTTAGENRELNAQGAALLAQIQNDIAILENQSSTTADRWLVTRRLLVRQARIIRFILRQL